MMRHDRVQVQCLQRSQSKQFFCEKVLALAALGVVFRTGEPRARACGCWGREGNGKGMMSVDTHVSEHTCIICSLVKAPGRSCLFANINKDAPASFCHVTTQFQQWYGRRGECGGKRRWWILQ